MNFLVGSIPIFINSVSLTLKEVDTPPNIVRITGWNGFLSGPKWEIADAIDDKVKEISIAVEKNLSRFPICTD
jgi:hypothetical protein